MFKNSKFKYLTSRTYPRGNGFNFDEHGMQCARQHKPTRLVEWKTSKHQPQHQLESVAQKSLKNQAKTSRYKKEDYVSVQYAYGNAIKEP